MRRMSEDVDFKVVPINKEQVSGSRLRKELGELRKNITENLVAAGFQIDPKDKSQVRSRNGNHYTIYQLPYSTAAESKDMLRPTIQIELTHARLREPSIKLPVTSFVAEAFGRPAELAAIDCVSVTETAAEKIVALTRRTAMERAGLSRDPDPTIVRHIYDLHLIRNKIDVSTATALARSIALQDAEEFRNQYPAYQNDIVGETYKALEALRSDPAIRERYSSFVAAMVYGDPVGFSTAIKTTISLVEATWPLFQQRPTGPRLGLF